jgi:hypothetical protein
MAKSKSKANEPTLATVVGDPEALLERLRSNSQTKADVDAVEKLLMLVVTLQNFYKGGRPNFSWFFANYLA